MSKVHSINNTIGGENGESHVMQTKGQSSVSRFDKLVIRGSGQQTGFLANIGAGEKLSE